MLCNWIIMSSKKKKPYQLKFNQDEKPVTATHGSLHRQPHFKILENYSITAKWAQTVEGETFSLN